MNGQAQNDRPDDISAELHRIAMTLHSDAMEKATAVMGTCNQIQSMVDLYIRDRGAPRDFDEALLLVQIAEAMHPLATAMAEEAALLNHLMTDDVAAQRILLAYQLSKK
jgi:hypothetical protein